MGAGAFGCAKGKPRRTESADFFYPYKNTGVETDFCCMGKITGDGTGP